MLGSGNVTNIKACSSACRAQERTEDGHPEVAGKPGASAVFAETALWWECAKPALPWCLHKPKGWCCREKSHITDGKTEAWRHSGAQGKWRETHSRVGEWDQHCYHRGARASLEMNGQKDKPRPRHDEASCRDGILQMGGWEAGATDAAPWTPSHSFFHWAAFLWVPLATLLLL